jgi:outer membrane protein assembly factor BamA
MGGMDGIRGYTYYSIGGRRGVLGSVTYRFPLLRRINKQLSFLTLKDIYGGVFFESANAWNKTELKDHDYKKSLGYEVRLNMGSWYAYPTTVSVTGAYPLDEVIFFNPVYTTEPVINEKQWRYYVSVGFTF